ncbi:MAG: PilZ domain-containing protein, partial [Brevundimonas sp.]
LLPPAPASTAPRGAGKARAGCSRRRPDDLQARRPVNLDGVVHGPGYVVACRILDLSGHGIRVRLDRQAPPPSQVVGIEIAGGIA